MIYLDKGKMLSLSRTMQRQLFRMAVERLVGSLRDIEAAHIEATVDFLHKAAGKTLCLPHGLNLASEHGRLVLATIESASCHFPHWNLSLKSLFLERLLFRAGRLSPKYSRSRHYKKW